MIEKKLKDMLTEEKWTRVAITNYTINDFASLDAIIEEAKEEAEIDELYNICSEHLMHAKMSIIALYIISIISLSKKMLDDSNQITLINIFIDNHKWQIVEHLCLKMLEYGDAASKFSLRTLASYYRESNDEKVYDIWERILKVDYEEADIAKFLAEKYEEDGDEENAILYYKKAIHRYVGLKHFSGIKEVWARLVALCPQDIAFFTSIEAKIEGSVDEAKVIPLLQDLYEYYKDSKNWKTAVDILKIILHCDSKDSWARDELVFCLKGMYKDHSQLEHYINISMLNQSYRPVFDALADFEKNISFEVGNFVFHRTWGVGRISSIANDEITIDFAKKRGHKMSLKMGISALKTLSKEHIWVLKATEKKAGELSQKIKEDVKWALKMLILSFDNNCDLKKIKAELVPSLLKPTEWTSWSAKAKKILNEDSMFDINKNTLDSYIVRDGAIEIEEKLLNEFKAKKNFFARVDIINKYKDKTSDTFMEMLSYFLGFLKSTSQVSEYVISSYVLLSKIKEESPESPFNLENNFVSLYEKIEDVSHLYQAIKDKTLRELFLKKIRLLVPNWQDEFIKLFPTVLSYDIIGALLDDGKIEMLQNKVMECYANYRVYKEACIWCFKNVRKEEWFLGIGLDEEAMVIVLIYILDITYREIASRKNTIENRKINKAVHSILFGKDKMLIEFMLAGDEERVSRIYTLISDIKDLEPTLKAALRSAIIKKYKDFKFMDTEEKTTQVLGLIVTERMLIEKKKELNEVINVLMPQNARDLAYAMSLGDLRENAEYKAAKEEQARLENLAKKLQDELERAEVFDPTKYSGEKVFFGTKVSIKNNESGDVEEYIILGPWESDPNNGIISYMSPLGNGLLHSKAGDVINYAVNDQKRTYKVLSVEKMENI